MMLTLRRYCASDIALWEGCVSGSRNGTFLFHRGYMDYHADRFADHSLLFFSAKGALLAVLPANEGVSADGLRTLYSHQGLTYGGFVLSPHATMDDVLAMLTLTIAYLRDNGFHTLIYKSMPTIYHEYPSEEDEYALWRYGAQLSACNISSAVQLWNDSYTIPLQYRRRRGVTKAQQRGYCVNTTTDLRRFYDIMTVNLRERYHTTPVHTLEEMQLLMSRFPENIVCYVAQRDGVAEAGVIIYHCRHTAHAQYIQSSPQGKADGALDLLITHLIAHYKTLGYRYFDLGISNEQGGHVLNTGLIAQKEGFAARGITYKQWTLTI